MLYQVIRKRRSQEHSGVGMITLELILLLPIFILLCATLMEIGLQYQARSVIQNSARDGARQVAIWGGNNKPLAPASQRTPVAQQVRDMLYDSRSGKCTASRCERPPRVTCTPNTVSTVGQEVSCTVTYYYAPMLRFNPIAPAFKTTVTITEYTLAEVRG